MWFSQRNSRCPSAPASAANSRRGLGVEQGCGAGGSGPTHRLMPGGGGTASWSFDNSVADIFSALCAGAALVLRGADPVAPDEEFHALLERHAVTVVDLPTPFLHPSTQSIGRLRSPLPCSVR